jgi:predicted AAA+ superfamily ATPase
MKSKIVKAYKADMDGFYSNIVIVEINKSNIDNQHTYFKSFNACKKYVVALLKDMMTQYKNNYMEMKALKKFD